MYHQKLVASIKTKGKILREFKDTVYVPFSSEYSILIKNLNTQRAVVNVLIDGENQTPDGLVINAGSSIDLERSIKNNNLKAGNKFKFIERSAQVENHRGIGLEDGIVRVEYQFEKPRVVMPIQSVQNIPNWNEFYNGIANGSITASGSTGTAPWLGTTTCSYSAHATSASLNNISINACVAQPVNDAGITVAGSRSTQSFTTVSVGELELEKHTIVLKLLGETEDNKQITEAITVKKKPKCVTCGKQNKATAKYCSECGTALEIFA